MSQQILTTLQKRKALGQKSVAVLLDPDDVRFETLPDFVGKCEACNVHYFFVGGSLIYSDNFKRLITSLKSLSKLPVIIFPGNNHHIHREADGILLLSLVSGRNPEFLIGQHVIAAPELKRSGLEILSTAYLLIESGTQTTVSYISNTTPIPHNKPEIAACTALAAEMIGMKLTYLDGGSGAKNPVSNATIKAVAAAVSSPLIVGGGLRRIEDVHTAFEAGADVVVIGNAIEEDPDFVLELANLRISETA